MQIYKHPDSTANHPLNIFKNIFLLDVLKYSWKSLSFTYKQIYNRENPTDLKPSKLYMTNRLGVLKWEIFDGIWINDE